MKTFEDLYGNKYLKADDLPEGDQSVTIKNFTVEPVGNSKDERCLLEFREIDGKALVLNKTNAGTIADLYGKDFNDWIGKRITLYATEVDFQGKTTMAIRIRLRPPSQKSPNQESEY